MREIKFRAWDNRQNKWIDSFVMAPTQPTWAPFPIEHPDKIAEKALREMDLRNGDPFPCSDYTLTDWANYYFDCLVVEQYTGLKDKNGKEIYEGDIIPDEDGAVFIIRWDNEKASFVLDVFGASTYLGENGGDCEGPSMVVDTMNFSDFIGNPSEWAEIIGNIHENPELIKEA